MWNILSASSPESPSSVPGFSLLLSWIPSYPSLDSLSSSPGFPLLLSWIPSYPSLDSFPPSWIHSPPILIPSCPPLDSFIRVGFPLILSWISPSSSWIPSILLQDSLSYVVDSLSFAPRLPLFWIPSPALLDSLSSSEGFPPLFFWIPLLRSWITSFSARYSFSSAWGFPLLHSRILSFPLGIPSPPLMDSSPLPDSFSILLNHTAAGKRFHLLCFPPTLHTPLLFPRLLLYFLFTVIFSWGAFVSSHSAP